MCSFRRILEKVKSDNRYMDSGKNEDIMRIDTTPQGYEKDS